LAWTAFRERVALAVDRVSLESLSWAAPQIWMASAMLGASQPIISVSRTAVLFGVAWAEGIFRECIAWAAVCARAALALLIILIGLSRAAIQ